jgi:hypothetical protein
MVTSDETQNLINELRNESEQVTRLYFEKIIDFLKWTTTIALGAFLWIGANYHSLGNNTLLINTSLASFGLSIMVSVSYIIIILNWINDNSRLTIAHMESVKLIIPGMPMSQEASQKQNEVISRLSQKYQKLTCFLEKIKYLIGFHGVCLVAGTLCFILAILYK